MGDLQQCRCSANLPLECATYVTRVRPPSTSSSSIREAECSQGRQDQTESRGIEGEGTTQTIHEDDETENEGIQQTDSTMMMTMTMTMMMMAMMNEGKMVEATHLCI